MITQEQVVEKLKSIYDPEIPVNIYDLGLIYGIEIGEKGIIITMTLTTATCPAAAFMPEEVNNVLRELPGIQDVDVRVVYEPRWTRERMSPQARAALGFA